MVLVLLLLLLPLVVVAPSPPMVAAQLRPVMVVRPSLLLLEELGSLPSSRVETTRRLEIWEINSGEGGG